MALKRNIKSQKTWKRLDRRSDEMLPLLLKLTDVFYFYFKKPLNLILTDIPISYPLFLKYLLIPI